MYFRKSNICSHKLDVQEAEPVIISLDAGSRMEGIPAHDMWNVVIEVILFATKRLHNITLFPYELMSTL